MAADDHDLVGKLAAANYAERVPDRLVGIRRASVVDRDARLHRAGPDVIPERKSALPRLRNRLAAQSAQQLGGIAVGDRQHRNVRDIHLRDRRSASRSAVLG